MKTSFKVRCDGAQTAGKQAVECWLSTRRMGYDPDDIRGRCQMSVIGVCRCCLNANELLSALDDLDLVNKLSNGRVDLTYGRSVMPLLRLA